MPRKLTRRDFLRNATGGIAAPYLIPTGLLAAGPLVETERPGPNERIGVGYIGVGRRGSALMGLPPGGRIVAVCDVDPHRAQAAADRGKCPAQTDYRKLLQRKDVDAVVVATPDHWHALPSIHACQAGKDVYCEKPLGLTVREGRAMVEAARKHKRIFQVGTQRRSSRAHRIGCRLVRSGAIGQVHTVLGPNYPSPWQCEFPGQPVPEGLNWDAWCGQTQPVPFHQDIYVQRSRPGWISLKPYSGGEMTGTGAHGLDLIQWALGMDQTTPVEVWAEGGRLDPLTYHAAEDRRRGDAHGSRGHEVTLRYAGGVTLKLAGGPLGGMFLGEKGKISIDSGTVSSDPPEIVQQALKAAEADRQVSHLQNWIDCIKLRQRPAADVEIGHRSTVVCHLGNIARWVGRRLRWDPVKEVFPDDDEANAWLQRPMRKPFRLPDI